jgi:rhodanese-related sulfurtransferase
MFGFLKSLFTSKPGAAHFVKQGAILIDVRTKGEYDAGHIRGSRNIPLDKIQKEAAAIKKLEKPVVTVCRSGARSGVARSILSAAGIEVYNGGAWTSLQRQLSRL